MNLKIILNFQRALKDCLIKNLIKLLRLTICFKTTLKEDHIEILMKIL